MKNGFKKSLAVLLSLIMILTAVPLFSFAQYDEGGTGYAEYEEMGYNRGFYNATSDQIASLLFDILDYVLENEMDGFVFQLTDPERSNIKLDFSVINDTDTLISTFYDILANDRLGGSFDDFDATALSELSRDIGDLKLVYALLDFVADNADILKTLLTGSFDFGKVIEFYPQLQVVNDFDVNSIILSAFGLDPDDENRATADEFLQSIVKDGVESLFGSADFNCSLDILRDTAYDFAHNILTAVFTSDTLTIDDICEFIQEIRIMGIQANRYVEKALSIAPDDADFASIETMFKAEYGTEHPIAAMTRTETSNGKEYLVFYVPIFSEYEDGTPAYSYSKIYTLDYPVTYLSTNDVTPEQQAALAAEYGFSTQPIWTSAAHDKYVVTRNYQSPFTPIFQKYVAEGYTIIEHENAETMDAVLSDGVLVKGDCTVGTVFESVSYQGLIAEQKQFVGDIDEYVFIPDYYQNYPNNFHSSDVDNIKQHIYSYKGKTYVYQTADVNFDYDHYDEDTGETVLFEDESVPCATLYELMSAPKLFTQIDLCFNLDFEALDYNSVANGGIIGELNHIVCNAVDMLIKDEVFEELALVDGSNANFSANLGKIVGMFWEPIKEILNLVGIDGMFDTITYDETVGLSSFALSWVKWIFNSPDVMGGEFVTLGDEVTTIAQFAVVCIQKCFDMLAESAGDELVGFDFNYKAQIYDIEGKVVTKTTVEWINLLLNMGVDLGIFCLNKFVPNVGLSPETVAEYKEAGWTWFDFLDEAVDWALRFVEGVAAISTDFAHQRGVTDGNGPWYKLSAILSDIVAPLAIFNCGKTYGDKYVPFDLGVLIVDKLLTGTFELDLGKIFSFLETNTHESNVFYGNPAMTAALKTAQQAVNSILPGAIVDADVASFDHVLENETLAGIAGRVLKSLNARKMYLVPAVFEILAKAGLFDDLFGQGSCGDTMTWKYNGLNGTLTISGYGEMSDYRQWSNNYNYDSIVFENDTDNGGITSIGSEVFSGNSDSLDTIEIPATVTTIGYDAFSYNLKSVTVEDGNTAFTVDEYGVLYTADMTELVFVPNIVQNNIANSKLYLTIPDTVTTIRKRAMTSLLLTELVFDNDMSYDDITSNLNNYYGDDWDSVETVICHENSGMEAYCNNHEITVVTKHFPDDEATITPATCTTPGSWNGKCKYCSEVLTSEEIPALGHVNSDWIIDTESTCSATGKEHCECSRCHITTYNNTIQVKPHTPGGDWTIAKEATCTEEGLKTINCIVCGEVADSYDIPALGHEPGEWTIDSAATCAEEGLKHTSCIRCNTEIENVTIAMTNDHTTGEWITAKAATCTSAGTRTQSCTVCNKLLVTEVTPRLTHNFGAWTEITAATCIANGSEQRTCSLCGKVETADIEKSGHTAGDWIVDTAATCTAAGSQHKVCTVCAATVVTEAIPAKGHTAGAWVVDTAATCTAAGSQHKACTVCGASVANEAIPAKGHAAGAWIVDTAATCTQTGSQHKACTVCAATVETGTIAMIDHHDDNGDGNCDNCGKTLTEPKTSFIDKIREFFQKIADWFKSLFGG